MRHLQPGLSRMPVGQVTPTPKTATPPSSKPRTFMTLITTITSLGQKGEGVAEIDGRKVFVPLALPGERVELRSRCATTQ